MNNKECYGCGVELQFKDESQPGFAIQPKSGGPILCKRCFRINHYKELTPTSISKDSFLEIFNDVANRDSLIIYIIDLFDVVGSQIPAFGRIMKDKDILVVGNKLDILPKTVGESKIKQYLQRELKKNYVKPLGIQLISTTKGKGIDDLMSLVEFYRNNRDVYIVGSTNVGKSSLINEFIYRFSQDNLLLTTSPFPGTTLDVIALPLDDTSYLFDTPGIVNDFQMIYQLDPHEYQYLLPKKSVKPLVYQLDSKQTLFVENLVRFDYLAGEGGSVICYFNQGIKIHRTKLDNADNFIANNEYLFKLHPREKNSNQLIFTNQDQCDIVIAGLGWFHLVGDFKKIKVSVPRSVLCLSNSKFI